LLFLSAVVKLARAIRASKARQSISYHEAEMSNPEERFSLLQELLDVPGIPGYEYRVKEFIASRLPGEIETTADSLGNLVATIGEGDRAMLFVAHMDELGFVVSEVREDGFLKIKSLGGIDPRTVFGRSIRIVTETGTIFGAAAVVPPHLMTNREKEMGTVPPITDLLIDIGAQSKAEAHSLGVKLLDFAVIEKTFHVLNGKYLCARALDDRLGCFILLEALDRLKSEQLNWKVHFGFSVQEEVGLRGAELLGNRLELDMAFAVDSASSADFPETRQDLSPARTGKGPAFRVLDNRAIIPPAFTKELVGIAEKAGIPHQVIFTGGGTDIGAIQSKGARVMPLAFPVRYTHSAVEMVHIDDVESIIELICAIVEHYALHHRV
jgi:putative aminopeptidase FrvX